MILLLLAAAWLGGVGAAAAGFDSAFVLVSPLGAGIAIGLGATRRPSYALLAVAAAALFAAGSLRFEGARPSDRPQGIALYNDGNPLKVRGLVDQEPEQADAAQRVVLDVREVNDGGGWRPDSGKVLVTLRPFPRLSYGDSLEIHGRLETPPVFDTFDYREYLAARGIASSIAFPQVQRLGSGNGSQLMTTAVDVRNSLGNALARALPEPEAALARGMLLGQRTSIPAAVTDDFNRAGISHLIAISGSNVTIVAELVVASLAWLIGRRRAVVAAMGFIGLFVLLVGASPSVVRAAVMGVMMLGAVLAGRPGSALTAVAFAAAVITALQPQAVLDVAFQLSFAATVGLILLQRPLDARLAPSLARWMPDSLAQALSESISVTTAASLAVFPITAANFQRVSLVAVPANIVAVPLFTATIVLTALTATGGLVSAGAGAILGRFAIVPLWLLIHIAGWFAEVPLASAHFAAVGLAGTVALYGALAVGSSWLGRRPAIDLDLPRLRPGLVLPLTALVLAAAGLVWWPAISPRSGDLRVAVLDVGQGDSILITTPAGQHILVDGGPSGPKVLAGLSHELGGGRRIDLMVLTHPQEDHVAGLVDVAERYDVRRIVVSGTSSVIGAYVAWSEEVAAKHIPVEPVEIGEEADLGKGVRLEVLSPNLPYLTGTEDDLNNNAVVLRLTYGAVSFLLTADLGPEGEARLLSERGDLHATVLKVGHHGSSSSSTAAFLSAVQPSIAVISVGADNTYGHPSPSTLLRLAGTPLYRTDRNGTVRFETDGERLFVQPDHGDYQLIPVAAVR